MSSIAETEFLKQPAHYLNAVHRGESLILSTEGEPTTLLLSLTASSGPRPFGLYKGEIEVPADFNEPLSDELLASFAAPLS